MSTSLCEPAPRPQGPRTAQEALEQMNAAADHLSGRLRAFDAALMSESYATLEAAREATVAATEAFLDARYHHAWFSLIGMTLSPRDRPR
ncbi:hypothetical protein [Methylobacterium ajmalii]|uniref:hypothetical protein n=1 Tax=Methylobacterium ajmalii TaxID=2738439 RepID=UPI002F350A8E